MCISRVKTKAVYSGVAYAWCVWDFRAKHQPKGKSSLWRCGEGMGLEEQVKPPTSFSPIHQTTAILLLLGSRLMLPPSPLGLSQSRVSRKASVIGLIGRNREKSEEAVADWGSYQLPLQS